MRTTTRRRTSGFLGLAAALLLCACGEEREAGLDRTTVDAGRPRQPPVPAPPPFTEVTLPGGLKVLATPALAELQRSLAGESQVGDRFTLTGIRFVGVDAVRQDPDGVLTSLAAILNAYPLARVKVLVIEPNRPEQDPPDLTERRARAVAQAIAANGVDPARIDSEGVRSPDVAATRVELMVMTR